jgi:phosphoribosylanthranilate isomerase
VGPKTVTRVKICCIQDVNEAWTAIRQGASALGLVSEMPSGPGVIAERRIATIAPQLPPALGVFLLTSKQDADLIIEQQRRCRVNTIQLCDRLDFDAYPKLHAALPGVSLVQVVHVVGETAIDQAVAVAPLVDGILLDSGNPNLPCKQLGGTGQVHNWTISRLIVERVSTPVFLAGGLRASNVGKAIEMVQPYAVDVCTGVRTNGKLDVSKLAAFFDAVRGAKG